MQRQRTGHGILAGLFGRVVGGAGASMFGGLIGGAGGASAVTGQIRTQMAQLDRQMTQDAARRDSILSRALLAGIGGRGGGIGNNGGGGVLDRGVAGGAGPGILGLGGRLLGGVGIGGALLGGLPGLLAPLLAAGVGGLGLGVVKAGAGELIGTKTDQGPLFQAAQTAKSAFSNAFASAAKALEDPLRSLFRQIPALMRSLGPALHSLFAGAATLIGPAVRGLTDLARQVLPLLGQAFRTVAPLMRPLIDGLARLISGALPGLIKLLAAARPALMVFVQVLGTLGRDIGTMFASFAPVIRQSAQIFRALAGVISGLFPILGQLVAVFARTLAPVFTTFARTIRALEPTLLIIGRIFAQLASAVLTDLAAAFQAIARLLRDITPSLNILARVLGSVFQTLENSGVFAILADAIESLIRPLATLINGLVRQLAPFLPPIIRLISSLARDAIGVLVGAVRVLVPPLLQLTSAILRPLLPIVQSLVPVINMLAQMFAAGLAVAIVAIVKVTAPLLILVARLAAWLITWLNHTHLLIPVLIILAAVLDPIPTAIAAIGIAIGYLVTHWRQIWGEIKQIAAGAWNFIWNGFGKFLLPLLGPVGLIALGAIELARHWHTVTGLIRQYASDLWQWIWNDFGAKISNFFIHTLPGWFDAGVNAVGRVWGKIKGVVTAPIRFVIDDVIDGLIKAFDWISTKVGGPNIAPVHPFGLARGGRIPGFGGGDRHPAMLEGGEAVIDKHRTAVLAPLFSAMGVPGFQGGGLIGSLFGSTGDLGKIMAGIFTGNITAATNAFFDLIGVHKIGGHGDWARILTAIPTHLVHSAIDFLMGGTGVGGPIGGKLLGGVSSSANAILARRIFPWPSSFWGSFNYVEMREAGYDMTARNPSGAYGMAQFINGPSEYYQWGGNPNTAVGQLIAMFNYIRARYNNPLRAAQHEAAFDWYDTGGWLMPGVSFNLTRRREAVLTPSQSQAFIELGEAARLFKRGTGATGSGTVMRDVYLTLPEGSTVAQALNEITFRMKVAEQQGFAGVSP